MFAYSRFVHDWTRSHYKYEEPISKEYAVTVNGAEVPVYTCRISAYPFNRVWTGFQRPGDQTILASFVNLVSDEPLCLTVKTTVPHRRILLKPYSKGIVPEEKDGEITFTLPENGPFVLEADSYRHCLYIFNSKPIPRPDPSSVTHYFGPGVHMPGKIVLHDNESVYVDRDALVFGCILAEDARDIRIFGNGLLDDSGEGRICIHCYEDYTVGNLKFYDCRNVRIEGVLLRDSAIWCVSLFHCFDVKVQDVKVFGQWRYNTDGVDIVNCQDITIRDSFLHSFDDTVTIKGIDRYADTDNENILTENCVLWCDWGKTCEVGIETACRRCRKITFCNCDLLRAGNTALDIANGDCAEISDVTFEDIRVEYNRFDTPEVYQHTDDMTYQPVDEIQPPHLIRFCNPYFRDPGNVAAWGIPGGLLADLDLNGIRCGSIHDVVCRDIRVYYDEGIPCLPDGRKNVPIQVRSFREGVTHAHIYVFGVTVNGEPLTADNAVLDIGQTEDLTLTKEQPLPARDRPRPSGHVFLEAAAPDRRGLRVMFVGNSMTMHGVKPEIGWYNAWGMAASAQEKDYVHLVEAAIRKRDPNAAFCICQAGEWERNYTDGEKVFPLYADARAFGADIVIFCCIANCPTVDFDGEVFQKSLRALLSYLDADGHASVVLTTGFGRHPGNAALRAYAEENGLPLAELEDLGDDEAMMAIGLFEHSGVAHHPGDAGMARMAERILEKLSPLLP